MQLHPKIALNIVPINLNIIRMNLKTNLTADGNIQAQIEIRSKMAVIPTRIKPAGVNINAGMLLQASPKGHVDKFGKVAIWEK
jgi:hypothetical protein